MGAPTADDTAVDTALKGPMEGGRSESCITGFAMCTTTAPLTSDPDGVAEDAGRASASGLSALGPPGRRGIAGLSGEMSPCSSGDWSRSICGARVGTSRAACGGRRVVPRGRPGVPRRGGGLLGSAGLGRAGARLRRRLRLGGVSAIPLPRIPGWEPG